MTGIYHSISGFGGFVIGAGMAIYVACAIVNAFGDIGRQRTLDRHLREHDRKRGGF